MGTCATAQLRPLPSVAVPRCRATDGGDWPLYTGCQIRSESLLHPRNMGDTGAVAQLQCPPELCFCNTGPWGMGDTLSALGPV